MIAKPYTQELVLAAPTAEEAMADFIIENMADPPTVTERFVIRIAPALKVPERFRTFVTWWPHRLMTTDDTDETYSSETF